MSRRKSDSRDDELHALLRQAINRRGFLRRTALGAGGLVLGNSLLAACGGGKEGAGAAAGDSAAATASSGKTLRISNWPLYIDKQTVPDFEKATGIKTEYTEDINDNAEFFAKIDEPLKRNQSIDREIIVLTDWMAGRLIQLGYVAPLDDAKFPNRVNVVDNVKDVSFDPGRKYSVPWLSGMTGIGYNPKKTKRELTSIADIFDPKFKGQVTMLTEMRDSIGLVMLGDGKDPAKATLADAKAAAAKIKKARENGQIRKFTGNDYAEDLAAGNITAAIAWSGDIQGLAADNPDLKWIAPKEGAMLFSDNMMIPKTDDRQDLAMAWINYVYDPKHSAQIVAGAPYLSAVKGAGAELAKIAPDLASSPLVNPPDELRARLHVFKALSDAEDTEFNRIFQDAIGA
ncbi:MAG TPA: spermidine/putrescine ABC transporter substrate-binding protein [Gemmatimonadales bacterium]|nr:spermidine/putrescine ABC transporter substrate-binding protein [Gemmatimonadales bacterium]